MIDDLPSTQDPQPQDPQRKPWPPPGARDRLLRLVKARADALQRPRLYDDGTVAIPAMPRTEAMKAAQSGLGGYLAVNRDRHDAVRAYLSGSDDMPEGWLPDESPVKSKATIEAEAAGQPNPIAKATFDYVVDPALTAASTALQIPTNIGIGAANLFGADLEYPSIKQAAVALGKQVIDLPKLLRGEGGEGFDVSYQKAGQELAAAEEAGGPGSGIVRGAASLVGFAGGLQTTVARKVLGPGTWLGTKVAEVVGKLAGKPLPALVTKAAATAGGLAGYGAATAQGAEGGAPTLGERGEAAGWDALAGAVIGASGEIGKAAFRKIMQTGLTKLGKDEKAAVESLKGWAAKKKIYPLSQEAQATYERRVVDQWVDAGAPGANMPFRKLFAYASQGGIEATGFSLLDAQFRETLLSKAWKGDTAAIARALETMAANGLGAAALHMNFRDIVAGQRKQVTPTGTEPPKPRPVSEPPQEPAPPGAPQLPFIAEGFTNKVGAEGVKQMDAGVLGRTDDQLAQDFDARRRAEAQDPAQQKRAEAQRKAGEAARTKDLTQYPQTGELSSGLIRLGWAEAKPQGMPVEPVTAPPGTEPNTPEQQALIEQIAPSGPKRYEIPDTSYWFEAQGDVITIGPKLRGAYGFPETMPAVDFYPAMEKLGLLDALHGKVLLPGDEISVHDGLIKAEPGEGDAQGKMRKVVFGDVLEAPLDPGGKFKAPTEPVPARGKDALPPFQTQVVDAMRGVLNQRTDLAEGDRALLGSVIEVLDTVGAQNDQSVAETLEVVPDVIRGIATGSPEHAGAVIKAAAEMLTTKHPEVAIDDMMAARPREPAAQSEPPAKEGPQPEAPAEAGGGFGITPAMGRVATAIGKAFGKAGGQFIDKATELYSESSIVRARKAGAPEYAEWGWQALTNAKRRRGQYSTQLARFEKKAGHYIPEFQDVVQKGEHGFQWRKWHAYKDADAGSYLGVSREDLPENLREIVAEADAMTREIRKDASELGMRIANSEGSRVAEEATRDVMIREPLPDLTNLLHTRSGPDWDQLVEGLAEANGITPAEVRSRWSEQRAVSRRDPIEMTRRFKVFPDSMVSKASGNTLQLLQADPDTQIKAMVRGATMRMGVVESPFGQDLPAEDAPQFATDLATPYSSLLAKIKEEKSPEAADAVANMLRTLHGMPTQTPLRFAKPGTEIARFIDGANSITNLWKAMKMTMSFAQNLVEPWGSPAAKLGTARIFHGYQQVLDALKEGGIKGMMERLAAGNFFRPMRDLFNHFAESGAIVHEIPNFRVRGEPDKLETAKAAGRVSSYVAMLPFEFSQKLGELVVAAATERAVSDMRAGEGTRGDVLLAVNMGISPERAQAMARGEGTDAEYDRVALNTVSQLMGGHSEMPAEKSPFALNRTLPKLVAFTNFFQKQMRQMRQYSAALRDAKGVKGKAKATTDILDFMGKNLLVGLAGQALVGLFKDGFDGLARWFRETWEDPEYAMGTAFVGSLFGGVGQFLTGVVAETAKAVATADADEAQEAVGKAASRLVAPAGAMLEVGEGLGAIFRSLVPGIADDVSPYSPYNGKSAIGRVGTLLAQVSPLVKNIGDGLFGISALALAGDDKIDDARSAYFTWMQRHAGMKFDNPAAPDKHPEFLSNMRSMVAELRRGSRWGDEDLMNHLKTALKAKDSDAVASSLKSRRVLAGSEFKELTVAQRKDLHDFLGKSQWQLLVSYDRTLEAMADRVRRMF